jgi:YfiH family protein
MGMVLPTEFSMIEAEWPDSLSRIKAFTTLRYGGVSHDPYGDGNGGSGFNLGDHVGDDPAAVAANRKQLNAILPGDVIFLSQVHGNMVVDVNDISAGVEADAVISDMPGKVCAVLTADCLPVLFADADGRVVAAAHAGWRGLLAGVLQNTVSQMRSRGAKNIFASFGPAIGPEQFEVGQDVVDAFNATTQNARNCFQRKISKADKYVADIYQLARLQLNVAGVTNISGGQYCTVSQKEKFYSYRRDGVTGRMASLIWIEPD